jgi:DNA-binding NarL/FixJ family response regulator
VALCTVLVVEDDAPTRARLARAVEGDVRLRLVGAAGGLREGLELLRREAPDVVLVDLGLGDGSGLELIRAARRLSADIQTMVVTVFGDEKSVLDAIESGARGYLLKDHHGPEIADAILELRAGGSPISPQIARPLLRRFQEPVPGPQGAPTLFPEIARLLDISTHTVTTYVRRIYRKLEVRSRGEAVYEALQLGLVKLREE